MSIVVTRYDDGMAGTSYYVTVNGVEIPHPCLTRPGAYIRGLVFLLTGK